MKLYTDDNGNLTQVIPVLHDNTLTLDGSGGGAQSDVIDPQKDRMVRIATVARIYVAFGQNPRAGRDTIMMPPNTVERSVIPAGFKIAVSEGSANITIL